MNNDYPPELSKELVATYLRQKFIYSLGGLFLGLLTIAGGIWLFMSGVNGSTNWTASLLGLNSEISDAAPGAILFIVGIFLVFITRYKVKVKFQKDGKPEVMCAPPPSE